jgi:type IV fimbrial biogenesis protein FimT
LDSPGGLAQDDVMAAARQLGMTLIELMTALLVLAIVLGIGVPAFNNVVATNRMAAAVNELVASIRLARSEAVKQRAHTTLCASTDGAGCNPAAGLRDGWIVFVDGIPPIAPNGTVDGDDVVILRRGGIPDTVSTLAVDPGVGLQYVSFAPTGFRYEIAGMPPVTNVLLCDQRGDKDTGGGVAAGRHLFVSPAGNPQVYRLRAQVQASPLGGC